MRYSKFLLCCLYCLVVASFLFTTCATKEKEMPITTSSDKAKQLFIQARDDFENLEFQKAAKLLDEVIAKDSSFAFAYLYRSFTGGGLKLQKLNIEKALSLSNKLSEGEQLMIKMEKAQTIDNDPKKSLEYLDKLISMFPQDPRLLFYKAWYFTNQNNDSASVYLEKAVALNAAYPPVHNLIGYAYMNKGDYENAEKEFKEYIRLAPERPNPYDSYGEFLLKVGRFDESIANYTKSYELDNTFTSSFYKVGDGYLFKGDYAKARDNYQKYFNNASSVDSKLSALRMKAQSYLYENNLSEALKSFSEYRAFAEKENKPKEVIMSYAYEGFALSENGRTAEGLKKYENASEVVDKVNLSIEDKENFTGLATMSLSYANAMNQNIAKAKDYAAKYKTKVDQKNDSKSKEYLNWLLGFIEFKEGKYNPMIEKFKTISAPDAHDKYYLAQAYIKNGDKESAKKLLNEIINSNENTVQLAMVWNKAKQELAKF